MRFMRFTQATLPLLLGACILAGALPSPALAQFSKSYKFLESVRTKEGQEVTDALSEPGSTIINTHDSGSGETALHIVTARRDVTWMSFLLGRGADANARDNRGTTPLVLASNLGFAEGVDLLIQSGARVDEASSTGETPLIAAVHRRDLAMMRVLLKAGANPDRSDNTGRTARDYAQMQDKSGALLNEINSNTKVKGGSQKGSYGPTL